MVAPTTFLAEVREELVKVAWPKQQEVIRLTIVVLVISTVVGLYIGALDFIFTKITETLIR